MGDAVGKFKDAAVVGHHDHRAVVAHGNLGKQLHDSVAGFMILGVIYLIYLYQTDPRRVLEVGLVHLDPLEEHET